MHAKNVILQNISYEIMHKSDTITHSNFHELVNHLFPQATAHIKQPTTIFS